jgi:hypothetical protein
MDMGWRDDGLRDKDIWLKERLLVEVSFLACEVMIMHDNRIYDIRRSWTYITIRKLYGKC